MRTDAIADRDLLEDWLEDIHTETAAFSHHTGECRPDCPTLDCAHPRTKGDTNQGHLLSLKHFSCT